MTGTNSVRSTSAAWRGPVRDRHDPWLRLGRDPNKSANAQSALSRPPQGRRVLPPCAPAERGMIRLGFYTAIAGKMSRPDNFLLPARVERGRPFPSENASRARAVLSPRPSQARRPRFSDASRRVCDTRTPFPHARVPSSRRPPRKVRLRHIEDRRCRLPTGQRGRERALLHPVCCGRGPVRRWFRSSPM